jgi:hypothetical protein
VSDTCPRCDNEHDDDPSACNWVRAIDYHEDGDIKRVEYHAIEGIQAPVSERHAQPVDADEGLTFRQRCILRAIEGAGSLSGLVTLAVIVFLVTKCAGGS